MRPPASARAPEKRADDDGQGENVGRWTSFSCSYAGRWNEERRGVE
jgi:hypothetical protein